VLFGPCDAVGWPAVVAGAPPAEALPLVRHFPRLAEMAPARESSGPTAREAAD